jgi:hypothetical protein
MVEFPWVADSCPWVGKLRTVLPLSDVIRDSAVQLVLTHQRARTCNGEPWCTCRCVRACVHAYSSILRCMFPCMLCTDCPCGLCSGYQPDRCLVVVCVGWLALRLSACEFGSAVAGFERCAHLEKLLHEAVLLAVAIHLLGAGGGGVGL